MATGKEVEPREIEDPAEAWIDLVTACHEPDHLLRRQLVEQLLQKARESEWTRDMWIAATEDVEYGGSVSEEEESVDITGDGTDDDHFGSSDEDAAEAAERLLELNNEEHKLKKERELEKKWARTVQRAHPPQDRCHRCGLWIGHCRCQWGN